MADDSRIDVAIRAKIDDLKSGMSQAVDTVRGGAEQMKTHLGGIAGKLLEWEALKEAARVIREALETLIEPTIQWREQIEKLTFQLGVMPEKASEINAALREVGIGTDEYSGMLFRLERQAKLNEKSLTDLGVKTRDANGNFYDGAQLIKNGIAALNEYRAGTDRNIVSMQIFGRGASEVVRLQNLTNEVMTDAAERVRRYGLAVDEGAIQQNSKLQQGLNTTLFTFNALFVKIGSDLTPALNNFLKVLNDDLLPVLFQLEPVVKAIITALDVAFTSFIQVFALVNAAIETVFISAEKLGRVIALAMTGQFSAALTAAQEGIGDIKKQWVDAISFFEDQQRQAMERRLNLWNPGTARDDRAPAGTYRPTGGKQAPDLSGTGPSQVDLWRTELQQRLEAEQNFFADSKEEELRFWEEKLTLVKRGSNDEVAIRKEIFNLKKGIAQDELNSQLADLKAQQDQARDDLGKQIEIAEEKVQLMARTYGEDSANYKAALADKQRATRAYADEETRIELDMLQAHARAQSAQYDLDQSAIEFQREIGQISEREQVQQLQQLEQQRYLSAQRDIQNQMLVSGLTIAQRRQLNQDLEQLDRQHNQRVQQLNQQATLAVRNQWQSILGPIRNAISGSVTGILQGTQTAMGAIQNFLTSILASFVDWGAQMLETWILNQIATEALASTSSITQSLGQITNNAAVAASGAYAATAAIPYIGPILAPGAAATAYAGAMSFAASLVPFAKGAWEIRDVTPSLLHPGEMVIPADFAKGMRDNGGIGAGGAPNVTVNYTANGRMTRAEVMEHSRVIAKAVAKEWRQFNPNLAGAGRR